MPRVHQVGCSHRSDLMSGHAYRRLRTKATELLSEIDGDKSLDDIEYVELLEEIVSELKSAIDAKNSEL